MKYGVYYWRRKSDIAGDITNPIKIGKWSGSPEKTIRSYEMRGDPRPAEILAVEYSETHKEALILETRRKRDFGILRIRGEWFKAKEPLLGHITALAEGEKPIQLAPEAIVLGKPIRTKVLALTKKEKVQMSEHKKFRISGLRWPKY